MRKLFKIFSILLFFSLFLTIEVRANSDEYVYLGGDSIGIKMKTGVYVAGKYQVQTTKGKISPWKETDIELGDRIETINGENITEQDAIQKGKEYLQAKKYENMQETYYMKNDGYIVINYAYKQGDIVAYPDLIKLKIALDNGEIVGVDATGYLNCHFEREIPSNLISIDEARKNISTKAELSSEKLAIIPTEFNTEVLCYEFKGKINEVEFIEYINAQTGKEEDTLIVTNTENGTLTE